VKAHYVFTTDNDIPHTTLASKGCRCPRKWANQNECSVEDAPSRTWRYITPSCLPGSCRIYRSWIWGEFRVCV